MAKLKTAIGIYFVIGSGSDCDGHSKFHCEAFVNEESAIQYCDSQNEGSDGVRYYMTTDMRLVDAYCSDYGTYIPLAIVDEDEQIKREHTYVFI